MLPRTPLLCTLLPMPPAAPRDVYALDSPEHAPGSGPPACSRGTGPGVWGPQPPRVGALLQQAADSVILATKVRVHECARVHACVGCVHVCAHVWVCACTRVAVCSCTHRRVCMCMRLCARSCMCACVHMYVCVAVHVWDCVHPCTRVHVTVSHFTSQVPAYEECSASLCILTLIWLLSGRRWDICVRPLLLSLTGGRACMPDHRPTVLHMVCDYVLHLCNLLLHCPPRLVAEQCDVNTI